MSDILATVGNTPVVKVTGFDVGPCELFVKLESANPSGSIKDRPARAMIEAAEADGRLKPGGVVVEATAGNTGVGLALVAARRGYRVILVVPSKMSGEKVAHLRAMGAEVIVTRSDVGKGHPEYYQDLAQDIAARTPGAFFVDQFGNPANPAAHERSTGPEILAQMEGRLDAFVVGVGSGGTLTGVGRYLKQHSPGTRIVLADPVGSILADHVMGRPIPQPGSWIVEGIGEDFVPPNCDLSLVDEAFSISDEESFRAARQILRTDGVLAGTSSGTLLAAAVKWCQAQSERKRVLTLVCDSGAKYFSKLFNDDYLRAQGWAL